MNLDGTHKDEILFKYCEGDLPAAELDKLLAELEADTVLADELELWEQTKINEAIPLTAKLEEKILNKTVNKGNGFNRYLIPESLFLFGIMALLAWPSKENAIKGNVHKTEFAQPVIVKNQTNTSGILSKNKEVKVNRAVAETATSRIQEDTIRPAILALPEPVAEIVAIAKPDTVIHELAIPAVKADTTVKQPNVRKKRRQKGLFAPSNVVLPVNRDL